jgi:electron transfer flavoprotein beta subunit
MKVLVAVKRVVDYKTTIRITADGKNVDTTNVKMSMNPFDEIAVEEAIRLKEQGIVDEILAVSIGKEACQETLRTALAMGADRAILVKTDEIMQPLSVAKTLKMIAEQEAVNLILLGKQAIDSDNNQVGQMLAGLLNWAQGTFASQLHFHDQGVSITREVDGGLETLFLHLPAVVTTDLRLNEPRYLSLPNIVKAKQKPMTVILADTLHIDLTPHVELLHVSMPEKRRHGVFLDNAEALVNCLKNKEKVI